MGVEQRKNEGEVEGKLRWNGGKMLLVYREIEVDWWERKVELGSNRGRVKIKFIQIERIFLEWLRIEGYNRGNRGRLGHNGSILEGELNQSEAKGSENEG